MSLPLDYATPEPAPAFNVRRATTYFALVYFSQGICHLGSTVNQPLRMYLQQVAGFDASQISKFWFTASLPWMIKPLYGLLSDFFPIFGYRRKSYLLMLNLLAAVAFGLVAGISASPAALLIMLALTGVGVAASDVVVDAMMVTAGRETGKTRLFQSAQWASVNLATIFGGVFGSIICARWAQQPSTALRMAGFVAMGVPLVVACLTWYLVDDQRAAINVAEFTATGKALLSAFTSIRLWLVVIFLFLIRFNPGMTTALYSHLQDNIKLSNAQLAVLDTISSAGMVIGALLFMTLMSGRMPTRRAIVIGLVVAALGILPNLLIQGMLSGAAAYLIFGITAQVGGLSQLTVAAEACPKRVEAVVFAALMAIENLSIQYCDVVGSRLYDGPLHQNIQPLILLSAGLTAAGLIFVPMLGGGGDKEKSAGTQSSEDLAATAT